MIEGGRFDLRHHQDEVVRFLVEDGADSSDATLYIAASSVATANDIVLQSSSGQVIITDSGPDCLVDAIFTNVPATVPPGPRWFELWLTKNAHPKPVKTGVCMIHSSRRP
jgi:hypothetical protein